MTVNAPTISRAMDHRFIASPHHGSSGLLLGAFSIRIGTLVRPLLVLAVLGLFVVAACASSESPAPPVRRTKAEVVRRAPPPPPPPEPVAPVEPEPPSGVEVKQQSEAEWLAGIRKTLAERWSVAPDAVQASPARAQFAFVDPTAPAPKAPPRPATIVVVDAALKRRFAFRALPRGKAVVPPKELRFLGEDRLIYELPEPPAPPVTIAKRVRPPRRKPQPRIAATPTEPTRVFVIHPLRPRGRPIRCEGTRFAFPETRDHVAYVAGEPEQSFLAIDGVQVYPRGRRMRTLLASEPAWSKDGRAVAFLETAPHGNRLVLLAALDDASGDTTWELPSSAVTQGLRVFWAGSDKLVVGKVIGKPVLAVSFSVERPPE